MTELAWGKTVAWLKKISFFTLFAQYFDSSAYDTKVIGYFDEKTGTGSVEFRDKKTEDLLDIISVENVTSVQDDISKAVFGVLFDDKEFDVKKTDYNEVNITKRYYRYDSTNLVRIEETRVSESMKKGRLTENVRKENMFVKSSDFFKK